LLVLANLITNPHEPNALVEDGMLGKITKASVDRMQPGSLMWDTSLVGFGARLQLRHVHYIIRYRINGRQKFLTIGKHGPFTPETARREAQRLLGQIARGVDPAQPKEGNLAATLDRYLTCKRAQLRPHSFEAVERHLRKHAAPLHPLALTEISRRDVAEVLGRIETNSGLIARNRVRSSLSAFFAWAIAEGLIEANPVQGTAKASEGLGRERVLSPAELRSVWQACGNDDFGRITKLLMLTGQRRTEIAGLRWNEVRPAEATIVFAAERIKNHREHTLPLSRQALAILTDTKEKGNSSWPSNGSVFASMSWSYVKAQLDKRAGIAPFVLHDIRRSVAMHMAELGVQPHVIEAVLNHVSGHKAGVAGIYNRARYAAEMRDALQRWADHVEAITS